jgi:hypothetical protein
MTTQGLIGLIIGGIQVQDEDTRPPTARADKRLHAVMIADLDALALRALLLEQHRPLGSREFAVPTGIGMMKTRQRRTARQTTLLVR